jgi:hypothetical protein
MSGGNLAFDPRYNVPRHRWVKRLLKLLRELDNQKYFVKRGGIDWTQFTWSKNYAVAVRVPENFPPEAASGLRETTLELTVVTKITQTTEEADDDLLDAMEDDILVAMAALCGDTYTDKDGQKAYLTDCEFLGTVELNGAEFGIQGWYITFRVQF